MKAEILYDFKNSKSLKIYPKSKRKHEKMVPIDKALSINKRALNASERELKHVMEVANRRLKKVDSMVRESIEQGHHLQEQPFIPEYLGFEELFIEQRNQDVRIYTKEGFNITRKGDTWVILSPGGIEYAIPIKNMFMGINILQSCEVDVNIKDYMDGKYTNQKTFEEVVDESIDEVKSLRKGNGTS